MKKILFLCTANTLLFLLFGLAFLFPFTDIHSLQPAGFSAQLSIFPLLLLAALILYPIIYHMVKRRNGWGKKEISELAFADEREKTIVAAAAKASYLVMMAGMVAGIGLLGALQIFSLFSHIAFDAYKVGIALLTALLMLSTITYGAKWCIEYRK